MGDELFPMRRIWIAAGLLGPLLGGCSSCAQDPAQAAIPLQVSGPATKQNPAPSPPRRLPVPERGTDGRFAASLQWGGRELLCNGQGLCEWGIFGIDLYTAALYCERRATDLASALEPDQRTVFHLHFVRSLTGAQLAEAYTASTRVNAGEQFGNFAAPLQQLVAAMQTVQIGDCYTFYGEPGQGLTIARNGEQVGHVDDDAFRRLFVRLYLGDQPPTAGLRNALLGKS